MGKNTFLMFLFTKYMRTRKKSKMRELKFICDVIKTMLTTKKRINMQITEF